MDSSRQKHLDSMRGIAAFIVVVMHFFVVFYPYSIFGSRGNSLKHYGFESLFHTAPLGFMVAGYFAVCLFFILSGYVLSYRYLGEADCRSRLIAAMVKRPVRLGGLVLFSVLLSAFLWSSGLYYNGALAGITSPQPWFSVPWQGELVFNEFLSDVVFSLFSSGHKYNYPLWTISRELYGSLLVFAFLLFFSNNRYRLVFQFVLLALFKGSLYQGFLLGMIVADINKNYDFGFFKRDSRFISLVLLVLSLPAGRRDFAENVIRLPSETQRAGRRVFDVGGVHVISSGHQAFDYQGLF
ncbi:MAG: acyltransferase family protein [Thermodesulfobacteriota bacterium]